MAPPWEDAVFRVNEQESMTTVEEEIYLRGKRSERGVCVCVGCGGVRWGGAGLEMLKFGVRVCAGGGLGCTYIAPPTNSLEPLVNSRPDIVAALDVDAVCTVRMEYVLRPSSVHFAKTSSQ